MIEFILDYIICHID